MPTVTKNRPPANFTGYSTQYTWTLDGDEGRYEGYWTAGRPEGKGIWDDGYYHERIENDEGIEEDDEDAQEDAREDDIQDSRHEGSQGDDADS